MEEIVDFTNTLARFFLNSRYENKEALNLPQVKAKHNKQNEEIKTLKLFTKLSYNNSEDNSINKGKALSNRSC